MAVNIVNIGFKGTYPSPTADRTGYVSDMDNNDIFYFLGTNYGTTAFSNPAGGTHLSVASFNNDHNNGDILTNNSLGINNNTSTYLAESGNNGLRIEWHFLTCKVKPTRFDINTYIHGLGGQGGNWRLQGSNNNINWENISDSINVGSLNDVEITTSIPNIQSRKFYEYIRILLPDNLTRNDRVQHREVKLYGTLFRTDGQIAGQVSPITTVESLPKFVPEHTGVQDGDILYYDNGIVTNRRNTFYETRRMSMTSNLVLTNDHFPNFYILNPGGSNRDITLPSIPANSQFFRIKTLDPLYAITILDGSTTVTTLDTNTLIVDLYWDGNEWTALNMG